jgi:hypothetical protein
VGTYSKGEQKKKRRREVGVGVFQTDLIYYSCNLASMRIGAMVMTMRRMSMNSLRLMTSPSSSLSHRHGQMVGRGEYY